jgi:hypothetical protein
MLNAGLQGGTGPAPFRFADTRVGGGGGLRALTAPQKAPREGVWGVKR